MMNGIHSARTARPAAPIGALAALFALSAAGEEPPSACTHLFRVSVPDHGLVVFLPESEIASESDAAAYLRWARETFPEQAKAGTLDAVWSSDEVPLRVPQAGDVRFLREGDDAVDASGRLSFVVAGTPGPGESDVRLRLKRPPAKPGEADPALCLTNAWVLPRRELLERWDAELRAGRAADVRVEAAALRDRFLREKSAGRNEVAEIWLSEIGTFVSNAPALWPAILATNRTDHAVAVAVGGLPEETLAAGAGHLFRLSAMPESASVSWMARDAGSGLCERDFAEPAKGSLEWNALAPGDVALRLDAPAFGTRRPRPRLRLSSLLPDELRKDAGSLAVDIFYADAPDAPVRAAILPGADGSPELEVEPHRDVRALRLRAEGYEPLEVAGRIPGRCGADEPMDLSVGTARMVLRAVPWPDVLLRNDAGIEAILESRELFGDLPALAAGATTNVFLNERTGWRATGRREAAKGFERPIALSVYDSKKEEPFFVTNFVVRRGDAAIRVVLPAPASAVVPAEPPPPSAAAAGTPLLPAPYPSREKVGKMRKRLGAVHRPATGNSPNGQAVQEKNKARPTLDALVAFWKPDFPTNEAPWMETFCEAVAHFADCRKGCEDCREDRKKTLGVDRNFPPKDEAFLVFAGWKEDHQKQYRENVLNRLGEKGKWPFRDADDENARKRMSSFAFSLVKRFRDSYGQNRKNAFDFWDGDGDLGGKFRQAYVHLELCDDPGCPCARFSHAFRSQSTFVARRLELLRGFVCDASLLKGMSEKALSENEFMAFEARVQENRK